MNQNYANVTAADFANLRVRGVVRAGMAIASGALLALSSLYPALFALAWIAFVPLLIALRGADVKTAYGLGLLAGVALYVICTHWMVDFLMLLQGYSLPHSVALSAFYWFYCAHLIALTAVGTAILCRRFSPVWAFPLVLTVAFAAFPTLFTVQVGETQSLFLAALQPIAITGVHGLDFLIGVVNVLIAQALVGRLADGSQGWQARLATPLGCLLVIGWFGYGVVSLAYWDRQIEDWDRIAVGMVQPHEPPSLGDPEPQPGYTLSYSMQIALSEQLAEQSLDVIVWPELRRQFYLNYPHIESAFQHHVQTWQTPLVFQDSDRFRGDGVAGAYNASVYLDAQGELAGRYNKIKRVPIAEYLPWFAEWPAARTLISDWLGEFYGNVSPGTERAVFTLEGFSLIPLICYEVMFPWFTAQSVPSDLAAPVLLGQSNNSWFGDTRQPYQHLHASVLRSVENRVPLVHAVNNGPSAVVLPSGRMPFRSDYRQAAAYAVEVPVNREPGTSFYSRYPGVFISMCYGLLAAALAWCVISRRRRSTD